MEALILFLLKAVGSGVVGHYLKKGLEGMDPHLAKMLTSGSSPKEIEAYVATRKELERDVEQLAETVVNDSLILPLVSEHAPTLETRAHFFARVLEAGFLLSRLWKADLLIKGSFFGPESFMLFGSGTSVKRTGVAINLVGDGGLAIAPFKREQFPKDAWDRFKEALRHAKGDSNDYVSLRSLKGDFLKLTDNCQVTGMSAMNVQFRLTLLLRASRRDLALSLDENGKMAITDWQSGLRTFVQSIIELRELFVVPVTDLEAMRSLGSSLSSILDTRPEN